jgi:hypothetical protein
MSITITRKISQLYANKISTIRGAKKEVADFMAGLSTAGEDRITHIFFEKRSLIKYELVFGEFLDDTELDDTSGAEFLLRLEAARMEDMRDCLYGIEGPRVFCPSRVITSWCAAQMMILERRATSMWELVGDPVLRSTKNYMATRHVRTNVHLFKKSSVPTTFADAFPKIKVYTDEYPDAIATSPIATSPYPSTSPYVPATPTYEPTSPKTTPTSKGSAPVRPMLLTWGDVDEDALVTCVESLGTKERKIWDVSEDLRLNNEGLMNGAAEGMSHDIYNLRMCNDWRRARQLAALAGRDTYTGLKRKFGTY